MRNLIERRFPQYLAVYLGVSFSIVQFITFLEERYGLSPHWTTFTLLLFALLIPAVALFIYNHGSPGKDAWTRTEKIFIPVNVLVAAVVLYAVFGKKDLSGVTTLVTTIDEKGDKVEREVAKAGYRQRLAIFNFDAPASDTALAWMRYGLPTAVSLDLAQNMFIDPRSGPYFRERLRELGFKEETNVPVSLKRRIATEQHLPFFTDAKLSSSGAQLVVDLGVYESATGSLVERRNVQAADALTLTDEVSKAIADILDLPEAKTDDQPVTSLLTESPLAFRSFSEGYAALYIKDSWPAAAQHFEEAVKADPTFAYAWLSLHGVYLLSNQAQKSMPPLQKAMDHMYRLPERTQYDVRSEFHFMKQDLEKAYAVSKMRTDLFPDDIQGYLVLAIYENLRNNPDGIIAAYQKILELDPSQQEKLRELGQVYERKGDFDNAIASYNQYAERFPDKKEVFISLGNVQFLRGKHDLARAQYEKALVVDPAYVSAMVRMADLERDLGNFDAAQKQYSTALENARTPDAMAQALEGLSNFHAFRGQYSQSIKYGEQSAQELAKTSPAFVPLMTRMGLLDQYIRAGQPDRARQIMQTTSAQLQGPMAPLAALGQMKMAVELRDPAATESAIAGVEQAINTLGFKLLTPEVVVARGHLAEMRGQCQQALKEYEAKKKQTPTDIGVHISMARCHRQLKQPDRAIEELKKNLAVSPFSPRANYEMALALIDKGDRATALTHLKRATDVWANADPTYRLAQEAKAKLREMGG